MNFQSRYIARMILFLALVCVAGGLLFPFLKTAFFTNPVLNGLIVFVLAAGIVLNFRSVFVLRKEIKWINTSPLSLDAAAVAPLRLLSPLALILKNNRAKGNAVISPTIARSVLDSVGMRILYEFPEKSLAHGTPAGIARAYKQDVHRVRPPLKLT